jgi:hypothetical protein
VTGETPSAGQSAPWLRDHGSVAALVDNVAVEVCPGGGKTASNTGGSSR